MYIFKDIRIYIYVYIHTYVYIYIDIYIHLTDCLRGVDALELSRICIEMSASKSRTNRMPNIIYSSDINMTSCCGMVHCVWLTRYSNLPNCLNKYFMILSSSILTPFPTSARLFLRPIPRWPYYDNMISR